MSNVIKKALLELRFRINPKILDLTFNSSTHFRQYETEGFSIDDAIMKQVITPRVLSDSNILGGQEINVSLEGLNPIIPDQVSMIYHIPKDRTQNRSIISALSVSYVNYSVVGGVEQGYAPITAHTTNDVLNTGLAIFNSHASTPPVGTSRVSLIGENTILVSDINRIVTNSYLRCTVEYDDDFNALPARSHLIFCKLVELAVKAYIFNTMPLRMNEVYLAGGQELGKVKEIIESYSDAEQMYQDFLRDRWQKTLFMADSIRYSRFTRTKVGSSK